jgi:hypothetical protein
MSHTVDIPHLTSVGCASCDRLWRELLAEKAKRKEVEDHLTRCIEGLGRAVRLLGDTPLGSHLQGVTAEAKTVLAANSPERL